MELIISNYNFTNGMEIGRYSYIDQCEPDQTKTHNRRCYKIVTAVFFALNQYSADQHGDHFAGLEYHLDEEILLCRRSTIVKRRY